MNVHVDALWEKNNIKSRSPEKSMIVREVKASDDDGFMEVGVVEGSDHCHHQTENLLVNEDSKSHATTNFKLASGKIRTSGNVGIFQADRKQHVCSRHRA